MQRVQILRYTIQMPAFVIKVLVRGRILFPFSRKTKCRPGIPAPLKKAASQP